MAIKRKLREEKSNFKKRARRKNRLDNLPESLQLHILSFLDAKQAVQTSMLSRSWVWMWTWMPVLDLHYHAFDKLYAFDKFVTNVLSFRDHTAKLNRLAFTRRGVCSAKILKKVLDYAFSQGVKQLEVFIQHGRRPDWPICLHASSDSLTSLKLQSESKVRWPFLGSFKNLSVLHLEGAFITKHEPFSGFPMLRKLILDGCEVTTDDMILSIQALQLSDLTISGYGCFQRCHLTTPKLRFLEYQEFAFSLFPTHDDGLPVLETVVMDFNGICYPMKEKRMFDDLLALFCSLHNAKSLTLSSSIVDILSLFPEKLADICSPFRNLKCLNLDFTYLHHQSRPSRWSIFEMPSEVKAYLLRNSPEAKLTMIYP